jgi:integrase
LRIAFPDAPGQIAPAFQQSYWRRAPMGIGRARPALTRVRVKTPKRAVVPLSTDEVAHFWSSFTTARDLATVSVMLLQGLRSQEVLDLDLDDLVVSDAQLRVKGKGNKNTLAPARSRDQYATRSLSPASNGRAPAKCVGPKS